MKPNESLCLFGASHKIEVCARLERFRVVQRKDKDKTEARMTNAIEQGHKHELFGNRSLRSGRCRSTIVSDWDHTDIVQQGKDDDKQ